MEDERIIDLFFERSEQAISELSQKYGRILLKVSVNAVGSARDAEECVNDAYLRTWDSIPPARPQRLLAYICRIVRNISIDRVRSGHKEKSSYGGCIDELAELLADRDSVESEVDGRLLSESIDEFLDKQNEINAMIFVRRYWYMDPCEDIAKASGLSAGAVRTRLSRTRAELAGFLRKKGFEI